ncbi:response regulator transcription factor [Nocardioides sp. L-11A]|uniref:response regulator n=1 Tax=Nocardioides sp. L-11A TaxID=3043848 RepID=UPI00249B3FBF|nr:response regulator transcription factor [Nocardioides sp. L-11A]
MTEPIRVLLVDDHPVVRDGLRGQLTAHDDITVVGEAGSAEEALALLDSRSVDLVLTDLRMPGIGGIELIHAVRRSWPDTMLLVLTTYDTDDDIRDALAAGARGYLLKDATREAVIAAIRSASRGEAAYSPEVVHRLSSPPPRPLLTARELEVLQLVAEGRTNHQIGVQLFIGEATVKTHLQHIMGKLDAPDRAAAVAVAYRHRLL